MADLLRYFEQQNEGVTYAPRFGGSYDNTDVLVTIYSRLEEICKKRNQLDQLQSKYNVLGGHQTRVRDRAVAKLLANKSARVREQTEKLEKSFKQPEARLHEILTETIKTRETERDFLNAANFSSAPQRIQDSIERLKRHFVKAFDLPEELLNRELVERLRAGISTGASTGEVLFTTDVQGCQRVINRILKIEEDRSSWTFEEVTNAFCQLGAHASWSEKRLKEQDDLAEELKGLRHDFDKLKLSADEEMKKQQARHDDEMKTLQEHANKKNDEADSWKRKYQELKEQSGPWKKTHQRSEHRIAELEEEVQNQAATVKSQQQLLSRADIQAADQLAGLNKQLSRTERELESTKALQKTAEEQIELQDEYNWQAHESIQRLGNEVDVLKSHGNEERAKWKLLLETIINTYGTNQVIPEEVAAPMLVVAVNGPDNIELSSDMLSLNTQIGNQAVAVDTYHDFPIDDKFDTFRMLKVLFGSTVDTTDMLWLERCVIPKVTKDTGVSKGKPSTYALMLYPALQNRLINAKGLKKAIAASALVEVYAHFPFKDVAEWSKFLQAMIPDESMLGKLSLLEQAAFARLVTTLASSETLVKEVVGDHSIGAAVLDREFYPSDTIPAIMQALLLKNPDMTDPEGTKHVLVEDGTRQLLVVDDGTEECIFTDHRFTPWSCCMSGLAISYDIEGVVIRCEASDQHEWRDPTLIKYMQGSPRYYNATDKARREVMRRKQAEGVRQFDAGAAVDV